MVLLSRGSSQEYIVKGIAAIVHRGGWHDVSEVCAGPLGGSEVCAGLLGVNCS